MRDLGYPHTIKNAVIVSLIAPHNFSVLLAALCWLIDFVIVRRRFLIKNFNYSISILVIFQIDENIEARDICNQAQNNEFDDKSARDAQLRIVHFFKFTIYVNIILLRDNSLVPDLPLLHARGVHGGAGQQPRSRQRQRARVRDDRQGAVQRHLRRNAESNRFVFFRFLVNLIFIF